MYKVLKHEAVDADVGTCIDGVARGHQSPAVDDAVPEWAGITKDPGPRTCVASRPPGAEGQAVCGSAATW
jgi:hypothetical protein